MSRLLANTSNQDGGDRSSRTGPAAATAADAAGKTMASETCFALEVLRSLRPIDPERLDPVLGAVKVLEEQNQSLRRELARTAARLERARERFDRVVARLERAARTDELTGLANRRWLDLMLEGAWAEAMRHGLPLALLMIDLDGFKRLNDRCGHQRGDEMLRLAGRVLRANCRDVDVTARYGGDEFCVLMPHTEPDEAAAVAERILRAFTLAVSGLPAQEQGVGMTIGLAHTHLSRAVNATALVAHADEALYAGKARGKNRVMERRRDGVYVPMRDRGAA
jgi:diguanylate cyclase (GGDEF)-like protein